MSWKSKGLRILLCVITLVLIIGARIPLLDKTLFGEEGNFASLIASPITSHIKNIRESDKVGTHFIQGCLLLVGRIDGNDILIGPGRNLMPYCLINKTLHPFIEPYWQTLKTFDQKTQLARIVYLGISLVGLIASLMICYLVSLRLSGLTVVLPYLLFIYAATTHLSIGSSIQPQLDGSIGVALLCSAYLLMFLGCHIQSSMKRRFFLLVFSATLISFGKNEWPIIFLTVLFVSLVLYFSSIKLCNRFANHTSIGFNKVIYKDRLTLKITALLLGIFLGVMISIALSPDHYYSWFALIKNVSSQDYATWTLLLRYWDILKPIFIFLGFATLLTYLRFKVSCQIFGYLPFIYFLFALGITTAYIFSGYLGDGFPRYLAPSLMIFTVYCVTLLPNLTHAPLNRLWAPLSTVLLILLIYQNYKILDVYFTTSISITIPGDINWKKNDLVRIAKLSKENPDHVYLIDASIIYYFPDTNFISADMGKSAADALLKNYTNKILVLE